MNDIDDAREERKESPSTIELLASLFEESKESNIRRVKEKTPSKSSERKSRVAVKPTKDSQKPRPINRRRRQVRLSGSTIETRATQKRKQVRKPLVAENVIVKGSGIKTRVQPERRKIVIEKRSMPAIQKNRGKKISESYVVKKESPDVSSGCICPPEVSSYPQRKSIFGSTTLNIVLPFAVGVLLTFLGTRLVPLKLFEGDQGVALAKNEVVENPAPMKKDVAIQTDLAATVESAKQIDEDKTLEQPQNVTEKRAVEEMPPKELGTPVSGTSQEVIVAAKQEVSPANPELSLSTHNDEAAKIKTFQRDENKSYPYSVYLGSYKNIDRTETAISIFQKKGLSPYWVRVDLGEKGIWYRVLAGYFQTKDEANAFIEKNQIAEARPRYVLYANLIGLFTSDEELREKNRSLVDMGYCPYVIERDGGESLLFIGAFYYEADAEKEHIELASKGIQSQLVKR